MKILMGLLVAVYRYRCKSCGVDFEACHGMKDNPLKRCEKCKKDSLERVPYNSAVQFKGSGFYKNDSVRKKDEKKEV